MSEKHILTKKEIKDADFYVLQTAEDEFVSDVSYRGRLFDYPNFTTYTLIWGSYSECSRAKKKTRKNLSIRLFLL